MFSSEPADGRNCTTASGPNRRTMGTTLSSKIPSNWKAVLICPDRTMVAELGPLLSHHMPLLPVFDVQSYPQRTALGEMIASESPHLCFLDISTSVDRAFAVIADMLAIDPGITIVALLSRNDPELILRGLRQGAADFLLQPFGEDQLVPAMEKIAKLRGGPNAGRTDLARIFCVMPAKGACGASTVAFNLACQWKRLNAKNALLADLDPMTGTLSFLMKLKSSYSFLDALTRSGNLDADLWKAMVSQHAGMDVLLAPENPAHGVDDLQDASAIVEFARQAYDTVIIDTNGVYGDWCLTLARLCDELLLVTTNELPALQSAQRALSYLDRNRIDRSKVRIIVNRYHRDTGLSRELIETALHTEVYHVVPSDYDGMQRALVEGRSVPANTEFGRSIVALADRLGGKIEVEEERPKKKSFAFGGLLSLFSRSAS